MAVAKSNAFFSQHDMNNGCHACRDAMSCSRSSWTKMTTKRAFLRLSAVSIPLLCFALACLSMLLAAGKHPSIAGPRPDEKPKQEQDKEKRDDKKLVIEPKET